MMFKVDPLSIFIAAGVIFFSIATFIYSFGFMREHPRRRGYYFYLILTSLVSLATALTNNLILFAGLWGFLGLTLYLLININGEIAVPAAKKTLIIIGGTDALMLLGIAMVYSLSGSWQMDKIKLDFTTAPSIFAYIFILCAAFAKAGAMPFHTWVPDCAQNSPGPVAAFLPASLDKLLGIYLIVRLTFGMFKMSAGLSLIFMVLGAVTILSAVMMALVQHDLKRLLGYHAVSQVGYMILGLASANPIGIAGALFHMANNAIYKSCLFFCAANVEKKAGSQDLDKLGGLAKFMPVTYISALIASLAISGVPPFNGFFSKWMIYQGVIIKAREVGPAAGSVVLICLVAAMFGSALTLASFVKLLHAVFLGVLPSSLENKKIEEKGMGMKIVPLFLALLCLLSGIFAYKIPFKYLFVGAELKYPGIWNASLASLLIGLGLFIGLVIFRLKQIRPVFRQEQAYVGGEPAPRDETRVSGTQFYETIKQFGPLKGIYLRAEAGVFDIYEQGKNLTFAIGKFLQYLHNGVLPTYLVWTLLGMLGLFLVLVR